MKQSTMFSRTAFFIIWLFGICLGGVSTSVNAQVSGITMPQAYINEAVTHNIPPSVLYTLALVESGRTLSSKVFRPWPWTLTVNAKPYFFENRDQATTKLLEVLSGPEPDQLGVGLMQVEWRFHKGRFASASDALDPYLNLKIGASIFKQYWDETGNLWEAIGRYHSKTPKFAQSYKDRFGNHLVKLLASGGA